MSQTTVTSSTQLRESTTVRQILRAYDIHQTGEEAVRRSGWDLETPFQTSERRDWDFDRNRIPPYREPATSHRLSDRPSGRNYVESTIVLMMFSGSYMVAGANKIWRSTAGRIVGDQVWRYQVGGEW